MNNKKKLVEESFKKMKTLLESRIGEAQAAPAAQQPAQVQQPAQKPAADPKRDQKIGQNIDATMDQAMAKMVQGLPAVLAKFAKAGGDKDGALDASGVYDNDGANAQAQPIQEGMVNEITFNEAVFMETMGEGELNEGGILGLAMAVPAILKYGGKAAEWTGKKMNSQWLQKWGGKTAKAGEKIHHKYIGVIEKVIAPFMPNANKEQLHKAANGIFMGGVAIMFAGGLAHPGILTGVKGAELGEFSLASIGKILPKLGFA
jgi:hypothetical protein